jgi:hypothetical protein
MDHDLRFSLLNLPNTAGMRGELVAAIKRLAYERYTQLELGTNADFEQLWSEAFFAKQTSDVTEETSN